MMVATSKPRTSIGNLLDNDDLKPGKKRKTISWVGEARSDSTAIEASTAIGTTVHKSQARVTVCEPSCVQYALKTAGCSISRHSGTGGRATCSYCRVKRLVPTA